MSAHLARPAVQAVLFLFLLQLQLQLFILVGVVGRRKRGALRAVLAAVRRVGLAARVINY